MNPTRSPRALTLPALVAVALLAFGSACSGGGDPDTAGRLTVDGRAEVASPGEKAEEVRDGRRSVKYGQRVKVLEGTAVLRLDDDRELELRTGTNVVLQELEERNERVALPLLLEADLLVQAPRGERLKVSTEGVDVIVSGGARISRGPVLVVSSYEGSVELHSADQTTTVPALRQASAAEGASAGAPKPLEYDADDIWDRRFLSDAIALGNELEARSKGFSAQISANDGRTIDSLLRLLPDLRTQPEFGPALFDGSRAPGESLVGAAIALQSTRGTFGERWAGVFGFRDEGAQWGLVALDQGVSRVPLLAAVDAAIGRAPRPFEPTPIPSPAAEPGTSGGVALPGSGGTGGSGSTGSGSTGSGSTGSGANGSGSGGTSVPSGPQSTLAPPQTIPSGPEPLNTGIPILDNTINALVQSLAGLLRSLGGT